MAKCDVRIGGKEVLRPTKRVSAKRLGIKKKKENLEGKGYIEVLHYFKYIKKKKIQAS
jgi:hypothetical protein